MDRLSEKAKPKEIAPNLSNHMAMINRKIESINMKIAEFEGILVSYKDNLEKMKEGPAKICVEKAAENLQKRKQLYEIEKDRLTQQSFRLEKLKSLMQRFNDVTDAMNMTAKELRRLSRKVNTDSETEAAKIKVKYVKKQCRKLNAGIEDMFKLGSEKMAVKRRPAVKRKKKMEHSSDSKMEESSSSEDDTKVCKRDRTNSVNYITLEYAVSESRDADVSLSDDEETDDASEQEFENS